MNRLVIFFVLLSSISLSAQVNENADKVDWSGIEYTMSPDDKMEIVAKINDDLLYYLSDNDSLENNLQNFHFIDLNEDNRLDFIYTGYAGSEQPSTLGFLKGEGGYFTKIFEAVGTIVNVKKIGAVGSSLQIDVLKNDNCYDCFGVVNSTSYLVHNGVFTAVELTSYTSSMVIPSFTFKKFFKIINPKYYLRSSPSIENEGDEPDALFGNVIAEFESGNQGYAFAKHTDETGRIWWFVALKSNNSIKAIFKEEEGYFLGWMSSRYLEEIK